MSAPVNSQEPPRTLAIQSVLYASEPESALRLAESVASAAQQATRDGSLAGWALLFGDSSDSAILSTAWQKRIRDTCVRAGGTFLYEFFGENLGHGGGHNRIAPLAQSDLLLFLNPDALLAADTLSALLASAGPGLGATDARQLPLEHPKYYAAETGEQSWASGACLLTPRAAFDAVFGFDSSTFFLYCDDVDYSWRVRIAGYRVLYSPAARVFHDKRLGASGSYRPSDAEVYYAAEAAILLAHKYSRPARVRSLLRRFRRDGSEPLLRAVGEYKRRRAAGELPTPIDSQHRVGEFVGDNYSRYRF